MLLTRAVAMLLTKPSGINRRIQRILQLVFDICCLKLTISSNITPRFKTEAPGLTHDMCRESTC